MENTIISFDEFELPFSSISIENNDEDDDDNDDLDSYELKENMESKIPKEAIFIGGIDSELENWRNWCIKDDYYIIGLNEELYDWALFRISWDDNWETWNWSFDARLKGFKSNYNEAAKYMLIKLWETWELDINDKENEAYLNFFNEI